MSHPTVGIHGEETTEGPRDASFDVGPLLARLANLVRAIHTLRVAANYFVYRSSHVLRRLSTRRKSFGYDACKQYRELSSLFL